MSKKLTAPETSAKMLMQGYDPDYSQSLYRQMLYAFGEPWRAKLSGTSSLASGDFPDFPDIVVKYQEIGRSRRILNTSFLALSKIMYSDPQPEFPQVDEFTSEIRKQFYLTRYHGTGMADGEWGEELARAFMDGDGLGIGFVKIGLRTNPDTKFQYVTIQHSPAVCTLWDRHERTPGRARWIAFIEYLPVDVATELFGWDKVKDHVKKMVDSVSSELLEQVRVIEYYDVGLAGGQPTRTVRLGNLNSKPVVNEVNPFGRMLPFAYYVHFVAPGMRRPVGRIALQMATSEAINEYEKSLRKTLKDPGVDLVDPTQLDAQDLRRWNAGDQNVKIKYRPTPGGGEPLIRVPGREMSQAHMVLRDMLERQFNSDSGTTDFERSNLAAKGRTLGENQLLDARSQASGSWQLKQITMFHRRTVEKVLAIAEQYDRDPVTLDIFGRNVPVNVPTEPRSYIANFLQEPSRVLISEDTLTYQDSKRDKAERLALLNQLAPLVKAGLVNPQWFAEEMLKAIGEKDPKVALMQQPPMTEGNPVPEEDTRTGGTADDIMGQMMNAA